MGDFAIVSIVLISVGGVLFMLHLAAEYRKARLTKLVANEEIFLLRAKVAKLEGEVLFWKERGDKYSANSNNAWDKTNQMADRMFAFIETVASGNVELVAFKEAIERLKKK